jgi:hypothetical protein
MAMTVKRRKDTKRPSVFLKKIADIPGGVCISAQGLEGVDFLPEGTPITRPIDGICYVIKHGRVGGYSGDELNKLWIYDDIYNVQVGDVILISEEMVLSGNLLYFKTVDFIDSATVSEKEGNILTLNKEIPGLSGNEYWSVFTQNPDKNKAFALTGTGVAVKPDDNVITDAWVQGVTRIPNLPPQFYDDLKGIINI